MKTKYYKGDVATYGERPQLYTYYQANSFRSKSGIFLVNEDDMTLVRRAEEPEFPAGLPPLPAAAGEGKHWVYRGTNWFGGNVVYAHYNNGTLRRTWARLEGPTLGSDGHYAELVPNEPYTPPVEAARSVPISNEVERLRAEIARKDSALSLTAGNLALIIQRGGFWQPKDWLDTVQRALNPISFTMPEEIVYHNSTPNYAALQDGGIFPRGPVFDDPLGQFTEPPTLTIDEAVAEFEAGACVFYRAATGNFAILEHVYPSKYFFGYYKPESPSIRITDLVSKTEKSVEGAIRRKMEEGRKIHVTDSRKNLAHFTTENH